METSQLQELIKKFGPYLAVELLLPGGSLIALGIWLYRNRKSIVETMSIRRLAARLLG